MRTTRPIHDRAAIISSGDEIVTGQLLDTNSRWIAEQLMALGILPTEHITVPDELPVLVETLRRTCEVPLVIMSGGLGPTEGDVTRQALAALLGDPLVLDHEADAAIAALLARRGREMTDRQRRQAMRPGTAKCLSNGFGTAPGLHAVHGDTDIFCLPGPPGELRPMWSTHVVPLLRPDPSRTIITRLLHIVGVAEADCVNRLGDLTRRDRSGELPLVGITASGGILTLRIRYDGRAPEPEAARLVDEVERAARAELGDHLFASGPGVGYEHLAATVIGLLKERHQVLGAVESCTGGMLGEMVTTVPGSSVAFAGGYITYANALKESLGVLHDDIAQHGAVSARVASQMAERGLERSSADWCLSITGIAGPDGGTPTKPVGTVHIGLARRGEARAHTRHFLFTGDREDIRRRACVSALAMLYFALKGSPSGVPKLLWEIATLA